MNFWFIILQETILISQEKSTPPLPPLMSSVRICSVFVLNIFHFGQIFCCCPKSICQPFDFRCSITHNTIWIWTTPISTIMLHGRRSTTWRHTTDWQKSQPTLCTNSRTRSGSRILCILPSKDKSYILVESWAYVYVRIRHNLMSWLPDCLYDCHTKKPWNSWKSEISSGILQFWRHSGK